MASTKQTVLATLALALGAACSIPAPRESESGLGQGKLSGTLGISYYVNLFSPPVGGMITSSEAPTPRISCGASSMGVPKADRDGVLQYDPTYYVGGDRCGQFRYGWAESVTLTASPAAGYTFFGWAGACSGTGPCTLAAGADRTVVAAFFPATAWSLSVAKLGTGRGSVSAAIPGYPSVFCGSAQQTCAFSVPITNPPTVVTLSATAEPGSQMSGWSGACSGVSTCQVEVARAASAQLTFGGTSAFVVAAAGSRSLPVVVDPPVASLGAGQTLSFSAVVTDSVDQSVTWSISEASGCGSVTAAGEYTAPAVATTCHVVATSLGDPTKVGLATAMVWSASSAPSLGVNVEGATDWTPPFYADAVKQARWDSGALGADGWPTGPASLIVATPPGYAARPQPYKLSFTGDASLRVVGATLSNLVFSGGVTTADLLITTGPGATNPRESDNVQLTFGARRDAGGGVRDLRIMRPGHAPAEIFAQDFLQAISVFSTLRLMPWLGPGNGQVNSNTDREWANRTPPGYAVQSGYNGGNGAAWEYVVLLANATGKDVWISIPYHASDDYITKLAQLFKYGSDGVNPYTAPQANPVYPPLATGRAVYIEWVNEVWNGAYETTRLNYQDAQAELDGGDPHHLRYVPADNIYEYGWRRVGYQIARVSNLFRAVVGDADMMSRFRPVLARQLTYYDTYDQPLGYLEGVYGPGNAFGNPGLPVSHYLYGLAGNAYLDDVPGPTATDLAAQMRAYLATDLLPAFSWGRARASGLGLRFLAYEGGQHLLPVTGAAGAKAGFQSDPRMRDILVELMHAWQTSGLDLFNYYTLAGNWGEFGYWGLSPDITNRTGPKWDAVHQVAAGQ